MGFLVRRRTVPLEISDTLKTSIIIPCYNAGAWLGETLDSALAQTWPDKEIIVVNDGSTDASLKLARSFESRGVRVLDQPNQGASAARNHGLRVARGELIQFLDADDLLSPEKIACQVELLRARPVGTVASCTWGRFQVGPSDAQFTDQAVERDFTPLDFLILAGHTGAMMHPSAWLVPRAVVERAGPWDETLSLNDDGEYFSRVLLSSAGVAYCAAATARSYYRSGLAGSLSQQRGERARRSQFRSVGLIEAHLRTVEDTPRTRAAAADYYQRFIHDFYPAPADLIKAADRRIKVLGGSTLARPAMGAKTRALAALVGWKTVRRLKYLFER